MLTPDQQFAALRGAAQNAENISLDRRGTIQSSAISVQRSALDLASAINEAMEDGKLSRAERKKIRNLIKNATERLGRTSSHVAEPVGEPVAA